MEQYRKLDWQPSGTASYTGTVDVAANQTLTYNGVIASAGNTGTNNLTTTPSGGILILGGANTYNGTTTITGGTLKLASSGSINNSTKVFVGAGALFDVSSVSSYTMGGGAVAQTLTGSGGTVTGSPTLASNGTFLADLGLGISGTPTIAFNGNLTLSSAVLALSGTPDGTDNYLLANYTGAESGTFITVPPAGYTINYGTGANSSITLQAIPEPASLGMLAVGALGLLARRRRRRHSLSRNLRHAAC